MFAPAVLLALTSTAELRIEVVVGEVDPVAEISAHSLRSLVRARLKLEPSLSVVAATDEVSELVELKRRSYQARFDDDQQSALGRDVSANTLLRVAIRDALPRPLLELQLFDVETAKVTASSVVEWTPLAAEDLVDRTVRELAISPAKTTQITEKPDDELDLEALLADPKTSVLAVLPPNTQLNRTAPGLTVVEDLFAPAPSLWSWRGTLLVDRGTIAEVEKAIDHALASTPRLHLSIRSATIAETLRAQLAATPRFTLETATKPGDTLLTVTGAELRLISLNRATLIASAVHRGPPGKILPTLFAAMAGTIERPAMSRYAAEIEDAWRELHPFVVDGAVDRARRSDALRRFLKTYPDPNQRRRQAELMLEAIEE